jgi:hypothetical protein
LQILSKINCISTVVLSLHCCPEFATQDIKIFKPLAIPTIQFENKEWAAGADQKGRTGHFISAGFLWFVIFFFLKNI